MVNNIQCKYRKYYKVKENNFGCKNSTSNICIKCKKETLAELKLFKCGDKVRARPNCTNDFKGGEGIIENIYGKRMRIMITKQAKFEGYTPGVFTNEAEWGQHIEIIEKAKEENVEFKVGDKVKIDNIWKYKTDIGKMILHGNIERKNGYNKATISGYYNELIIAWHIDFNNKKVQLGYKPKQLTLIKQSKPITSNKETAKMKKCIEASYPSKTADANLVELYAEELGINGDSPLTGLQVETYKKELLVKAKDFQKRDADKK